MAPDPGSRPGLGLWLALLCGAVSGVLVDREALLEVSFGGQPAVAGRPLDLEAAFSSTSAGNGSSGVPAASPAPQAAFSAVPVLVALGADLDTYLPPVPAAAAAGAQQQQQQQQRRLAFDGVLFPRAGQYLLAINDQAPGGVGLDSSTLVGIGGRAELLMAPFNVSLARAGVGSREVVVRPLPAAAGRAAVSLASLVAADGQPPSAAAAAAAAAAVSDERAVGRAASASPRRYRVSLRGPAECVAGEALALTWSVSDAASGEPVPDLVPHHGALLHLVAVSSDLSYLEVAAVCPAAGGNGSSGGGGRKGVGGSPRGGGHSSPAGSFTVEVLLPLRGAYALVGVVRRSGELVIAPFYLSCGGRGEGPPPAGPAAQPRSGARPAALAAGLPRAGVMVAVALAAQALLAPAMR